MNLCRHILSKEVVPARHKRGAALVVVLLTVSILTTVVVDFVYQTRVQLHMVVNQRDELRAYYLARSGMDLARLALGFQKQVNTLGGNNLNIQIWQYLNQFLGAFNAAKIDLPVASIDLSPVAGLGQIKGAFDVEIEPLDGKINVNALGNSPTDRARLETIARLTMLMFPGEHKELFERKDASGQFNDIPEIIASLIDYIDADQDLTTMSGENLYVPTGPGQEANRYRSYKSKIKPRNAKIDTLMELYRVKGISEEWYDRFATSLTIYPSTKTNVNTANIQLLMVLICSHLANPQDPLCVDPNNLLDLLDIAAQIEMIRNIRRSLLMMTPFPTKEMFTGFLRGNAMLGMKITRPLNLNWTELNKNIEVRSPSVYEIRAEGRIGNTTKTLVAVIDINKSGRLYYWREF